MLRPWRYEVHAGNRLVQMQRGFLTQQEAQNAGERAKQTIEMLRSFGHIRTPQLSVTTTADSEL